MRSGEELFDSCEEIHEWSSVGVMSGIDISKLVFVISCVSNNDRDDIFDGYVCY